MIIPKLFKYCFRFCLIYLVAFFQAKKDDNLSSLAKIQNKALKYIKAKPPKIMIANINRSQACVSVKINKLKTPIKVNPKVAIKNLKPLNIEFLKLKKGNTISEVFCVIALMQTVAYPNNAKLMIPPRKGNQYQKGFVTLSTVGTELVILVN